MTTLISEENGTAAATPSVKKPKAHKKARVAPRRANVAPPKAKSAGRHVREVANSRGKSLSRDDEHRWADSPSRGAATPIRAPNTHVLWRHLAESLLVNGAPQSLLRCLRL